MSSQEQERIEILSVENSRLRSDYQRAMSSNAALARQSNVSADRLVEALEDADELRIALAASKMREGMLLADLADLRSRRSEHALLASLGQASAVAP